MLRDDVIEYSLDAHHSEEEGKKIRKKIYKVTLIMTAITALEVFVGIIAGRSITHGLTWELIKYGYIALTIVKAGYIVLNFMHLGDERKSLKYMILVPYFIFICYLIFISLTEANAVGAAWAEHGIN